jgi:peptide methionine sulfoxide reductase MsrB
VGVTEDLTTAEGRMARFLRLLEEHRAKGTRLSPASMPADLVEASTAVSHNPHWFEAGPINPLFCRWCDNGWAARIHIRKSKEGR